MVIPTKALAKYWQIWTLADFKTESESSSYGERSGRGTDLNKIPRPRPALVRGPSELSRNQGTRLPVPSFNKVQKINKQINK